MSRPPSQHRLPALPAQPSILFVTATRIGDAVLSTGLLHHLVETYPGARITIAAGPVAAPLFEGVPGLTRLIRVTKRRRGLHWLSLWRQVVATRWDLVIDLRGSALAWLLRAGVRRTSSGDRPDAHRVVQLGNLLGLDPPPAPHLWTLPTHEAAAARLIPLGAPVLAIAPTANWAGKIWPAERFAELIRHLIAPGAAFAGARVAVYAAPHERGLAAPVLTAVPHDRLLDLTGEADLLTVAASLGRAQLFIGNDTGLMHMAAAMGTPTLGLFGPSPAALYAPWGLHTSVAQTDRSYEELVGAPDFDHRTTGSLMGTLSVETVERAASALIHSVSAAA